MRIVKNRLIIAALCFLLSAAVAFVVLPKFYANKDATRPVCRAAEDIPRGTLIEAKHIVQMEVGAYNLPDAAVSDPEAVIGQYALTDIPKDDLILLGKTGDFLFSQTLDDLMKQGKRLVTVTLSGTASGVSGHLRPGDIVSVACFLPASELVVTDPETGFDVRQTIPAQTVIPPELRSVSVFDVENAKTESVEDVKKAEDHSADPVPKTVTLIVTEAQSLKLVELENTGKIHLIFERRVA